MTNDKEYKLLEELVNRMVGDIPPQPRQSSLFPSDSRSDQEMLLQKVGLLERALEQLRLKHKALENEFAYEDFAQGNIFVAGDRIHFAWRKDAPGQNTGTSPVCLQPKLLTFLLLYHRDALKVIDIIDRFIHKIWDSLTPMDFKRTQTGVLRCFTNTRFAALSLRDYGLLRFTKNEAYKTWVLSLPGFVAASKLVETGSWGIDTGYSHRGAIHRDVFSAWHSISDYPSLVRQLSSICEPGTDVFKTFDPVLQKAHRLLERYWFILRDNNLNKEEKIDATGECVQELDSLPGMSEFYHEFSAHLNVVDLIKHFE